MPTNMQTSRCQRSQKTTEIPTANENPKPHDGGQGCGLICRGRLWVKQTTAPTTQGDMDRCQREMLELQRPSQKQGYVFVSKRYPLKLNQSLPVAWGTAALSFRPCGCPSQSIVLIFLGIFQRSSKTWPPCFTKCFPRIFLLCLPLQNKKAFFFFFLKKIYVYINTWQVLGTEAASKFLLLAQCTCVSRCCIWDSKSRLRTPQRWVWYNHGWKRWREEQLFKPEGLPWGDVKVKGDCSLLSSLTM